MAWGETHHSRVDESGPATLFFKQGKNERHGGAPQQDQDQLVLELLEDELPERRGGVIGNGCRGMYQQQVTIIPPIALLRKARLTILAVLRAQRDDLAVVQALRNVDAKVGEDLLRRPSECALHIVLRLGRGGCCGGCAELLLRDGGIEAEGYLSPAWSNSSGEGHSPVRGVEKVANTASTSGTWKVLGRCSGCPAGRKAKTRVMADNSELSPPCQKSRETCSQWH